MISYPFISDLFTNVLSKSKAIEGRFYLCPQGTDINSDVLGQVLTDITFTNSYKKYPLAMMMPPRSSGSYVYGKAEMIPHNITLFFLKSTYYGTGSNINPNTNTSLHTVPQDWHDMGRCASSFLRVLDKLQRAVAYQQLFRIPVNVSKSITPISKIGIDAASGVRVDFTIELAMGCEIEDYKPEDISLITVPVGDSHPEHNM